MLLLPKEEALQERMPIFYVSSLWLFESVRQLGHAEIGKIVVSVISDCKFCPTVVFPFDRDLGMLLPCHLLCLVLICLQLLWAFILVVPLLLAVITFHAKEASVCVQ